MWNYDEMQKALEMGERPQAGGHVMKIVRAENNPEKQYIKMLLDYAEGPFKDYGSQLEAGTTWSTGYITYYASYKQNMLGRMKVLCRLLEEGNKGRFSGRRAADNELEFVNKGIGVVTQEEEYLNGKGEMKTRLVVGKFYLPNEIREKKFEPLPKKLLDESKKPDARAAAFQHTASTAAPFSGAPVADDELPF